MKLFLILNHSDEIKKYINCFFLPKNITKVSSKYYGLKNRVIDLTLSTKIRDFLNIYFTKFFSQR